MEAKLKRNIFRVPCDYILARFIYIIAANERDGQQYFHPS